MRRMHGIKARHLPAHGDFLLVLNSLPRFLRNWSRSRRPALDWI